MRKATNGGRTDPRSGRWIPAPELKHKVTHRPKHDGDCPACKAAYDAGTPWTALPWSETYWSS